MRNKMSLEEAIKICTDLVGLGRESENIPISAARDRVASENVIALNDVPPFDRSKLDGYAVTAGDFEQINAGIAADYKIIGQIAAGSNHNIKLCCGTTARIMTGAPLPEGAHAVIRQEYTVKTGNRVNIMVRPGSETGCESRGSILSKAQEIDLAGSILNERLMELLISAGINSVKVFRRPRVYIISTGSELVMPGQPAAYGHIYNTNFSMLTGKLEREGCEVIQGRGDLNDTLPEIKKEVRKALDSADLVIITGGASEGDFDLVPAALRENGCQILCGELEMRPGRHTTIAVKDNVLIFNLPGNPNGGSILFDVLISPALRKLRGIKDFRRIWFNIGLAGPARCSASLRTFCRGQLIDGLNGPEAVPLQKNLKIEGIAPVILDIPAGKGQQGSVVRALLL